MKKNSHRRSPRIVIIGAGMSGICQAILLRRAGFDDVAILEKASRLGGTWRDNRYPGLACDVPSHLYQYSFDLSAHWSRLFSPGAEIRSYLERSAKRNRVDQLIRYGTEVVDAYHAVDSWQLTTASGEVIEADFVIFASGFLHHPRTPHFDGAEVFRGQLFHSAEWPADTTVAGKRVAVIGNGSTGVQLVSAIAGVAAHVTLFQRTPQWVAKIPNPPIPNVFRAAMARVGALRAMSQWTEYKLFEIFSAAPTSDDVRRRAVNLLCTRNLASVADPELRAKLTPRDKPLCRRLILHPNFYEVVQRPDVSVETTGITRFEQNGIVTSDGRQHEVDIVVMATGFDAHAYVRPATVRSSDGHSLDAAWAESPRAYKSVAIESMPNMFMLLGPHSPIGNFSLVQIAEAQAAYVRDRIERWAASEYDTIRPTGTAVDGYLNHIRDGLPGTVWTSGCSSWYIGPDGRPELWPYRPADYLSLLEQADDASYQFDTLNRKAVPCPVTR